jgi:hypothetical protein
MSLRKIIYEALRQSDLPPIDFPLIALKKAARHFKDFKVFSKWYSVDINHGYYWHWTHDRDFALDDRKGPRDMSSLTSRLETDEKDMGALMVTSDLNHWDFHYNHDEDTEELDVRRPYAALFDASGLHPSKLKQVSRGFGNEFYLPPSEVKKLKLLGVYDRETAIDINRRYNTIIPQTEQALFSLWKKAKGG